MTIDSQFPLDTVAYNLVATTFILLIISNDILSTFFSVLINISFLIVFIYSTANT